MTTTNYMLARITATHCCVCRSPLTDAESVEHGIGPVCSKRYYNPKHQPDDDQVKVAIGKLAVSGLPDDIIDGFLKVVNNDHVNARHGCNILVKWASAHYDDRDVVFKCSSVIRALGYTDLADKLEDDRTVATIRHFADRIEAFIPDQYTLERDMKKIPDAVRMKNADGTDAKIGRKVGWTFPLERQGHFEAVLGVHLGGKLACGTKGVHHITSKRWTDVYAFLNPPPPVAPMPAPVAPVPAPAMPTVGNVQVLTNNGLLEIYSPFNRGFIDALKTTIPANDRRWTGRCWTVKPLFRAAVANLINTHYGVNVPV